MLGYDPFWDRAIYPIFPQEGQELWYVNEERADSSILSLLHKRMGRYILGGEGNYEQFIQALHWRFAREKTLLQYSMTDQRNGEKPIYSFSPPDITNDNKTSPIPQRVNIPSIHPVLSNYEKEQIEQPFLKRG